MTTKFCKYYFCMWVAVLSMNARADLWPVTVFGSFAYGGGFGEGYEFGAGGGSAGSPASKYPQMIAAISQILTLQHVRCSAVGYRDVTSHSDEVDRNLAAEAVFRVIKQPQTLFDQVFRKKPYYGGSFTVFYADGGQEEFTVIDPTLTSAMPGGPVRGSLKSGDGKVRPHAVCG